VVDLVCERCGTGDVDDMYARLAQIRFLQTLCKPCYVIVKEQHEAEQTYIDAGVVKGAGDNVVDLRAETAEQLVLPGDREARHECASCGASGSDVMACDYADMIHLCSDCADRLAVDGHIRLSNGMPLSVTVSAVGGGA